MEDDTPDGGTKGSAAVYVSWATFRNALEGLVQGVPNRIDRTAFPGMAWAVQSQLLAGLKFLRLIDDKLEPTPLLHALAVPDEEQRKAGLRTLLRERYPDLFALDLQKTTPAQLDEQMTKSYSVRGETREKAVRFFLSAADYVGVPLSALLRPAKSSGNGGSSVARKRRIGPRPKPPAPDTKMSDPPTPQGTSRTIDLKSGGTLTLSASLDLFSLAPADRQFVFELIDKLDQYQKESAEQE